MIKLNDIELKPNEFMFGWVCIREHECFSLPTLELRLIDPFLKVEKTGLVTGAKLSILLAQSQSDQAEWADFKIFSIIPSNEPSSGKKYDITAYMDAYDYLFSKVSNITKGKPSSDIAKVIGGNLNLKMNVDDTSDNRNWNCHNKTLAEFWNTEVVPQAKGNKGLMMQCVSALHKTFYYKDVNTVLGQDPKWKLINNPKATPNVYNYFFNEDTYEDKGGTLNRVAVGLKNTVYNAFKGVWDNDTHIKVNKTNTSSNVNKDTVVPESFRTFAPLDFGNNGTGFVDKGKNLRLRSLFSMNVDILVKSFTKIEPFDCCQIDFYSAYEETGTDKNKSSKWLCVGKARVATPSDYAERLCFVRDSSAIQSDKLY